MVSVFALNTLGKRGDRHVPVDGARGLGCLGLAVAEVG